MLERLCDATDLKILAVLQKDARLSNVDIADQVHLSASPCLRRTRRMEAAGIIRGYRVDIDRNRVGLGITVFAEIKAAGHSRENADMLSAELAKIPEVVSCFMVSGQADFLAEIVVENLAAYEQLLSSKLLTLAMVGDVRSNFALRTIKANAPLPLPDTRVSTVER